MFYVATVGCLLLVIGIVVEVLNLKGIHGLRRPPPPFNIKYGRSMDVCRSNSIAHAEELKMNDSDKISNIIMKATYDSFDPVETTFEVSSDGLHLTELLGIMERFLRATGWHFDGTLGIIAPLSKKGKNKGR